MTKIDRAIAAQDRSPVARGRPDVRALFLEAISKLAEGGARIHLLAHDFDGYYTEPFEVVSSKTLPLAEFVARGDNYFPENTLVSLET